MTALQGLELNRANRHRWIRTRLVGLLLAAYLLTAYCLVPAVWSLLEQHSGKDSELPQLTSTSDGHPGDPINVSLIGSESELQHTMKAAGWFRADKLSIESDVAIAVDSVLDREYDEAPVSRLFLMGREEDLAFELPIKSNPRHRHHVRFWRLQPTETEGRFVWYGSASFDNRVGFSHTTGEITHHIAAEVDAERDFVAETVRQTNRLTSEHLEARFHDTVRGYNGGGDLWTTDGALWQATIRKEYRPNS